MTRRQAERRIEEVVDCISPPRWQFRTPSGTFSWRTKEEAVIGTMAHTASKGTR